MRFAILGSGAVGGYFGARLARAGEDVSFVARGAHLDAIRSRGLQVKSARLGDFLVRARAESDTAAIGPVDVVFLTVKTYDNHTALPMLAPLVGPSTVVLTLQNGVDSMEEVAAVAGEPHVLGGTTYVAAALEAPGLIVQTGVHRSIIFGEVHGDRSRVSARVQRLAGILSAADIQVTAVADARVPIWDKFVYLVPFSGFTGAARLPIGSLWTSAHAQEMFYATSREVAAIARAEGVTISPDRFETLKDYMDNIPPTTRSSLLIDLEQGKRIEVEALQGAAVRRASAHGVAAPITSALYAVLKPWEAGNPPQPRMTPLLALSVALAGSVAGALGALFGIGGGVLLVPFLVVGLHMPMQQAVGVSLVTVIATSSAVASRPAGRQLINLRLGILLEVATAIGGLLGSLTVGAMSTRVLAWLFSAVTGGIALATLARLNQRNVLTDDAALGEWGSRFYDEDTSTEVGYTVKRLPLALAGSFVAGNLSTMLGIGGGVVKVPLLNTWCGVPLRVAAATSAFMIGVTATSGAIVYYGNGLIEPATAAAAVLGVRAGSAAGLRWGVRAPVRALKIALAAVLLLVAAFMGLRAR